MEFDVERLVTHILKTHKHIGNTENKIHAQVHRRFCFCPQPSSISQPAASSSQPAAHFSKRASLVLSATRFGSECCVLRGEGFLLRQCLSEEKGILPVGPKIMERRTSRVNGRSSLALGRCQKTYHEAVHGRQCCKRPSR